MMTEAALITHIITTFVMSDKYYSITISFSIGKIIVLQRLMFRTISFFLFQQELQSTISQQHFFLLLDDYFPTTYVYLFNSSCIKDLLYFVGASISQSIFFNSNIRISFFFPFRLLRSPLCYRKIYLYQ